VRTRRKLSAGGLVLVVVGVIIFSAGSLGLLASIILDTTPPSITPLNPTGTESSPTVWTINTATQLFADLYDTSLPLTEKAVITEPDGTVLTLASESPFWSEFYTWFTPTQEGKYKVVFDMTDAVGNEGTSTVWGSCTSIAPTGDWKWDGIAVELGANLGITNQISHTISWTQTGGETATKVYVRYWIPGTGVSSVNLSKSGDTWSGTINLDKGDGSYIIEGHVAWSTYDVVLLSILTSVNSETKGQERSIYEWISMFTILAGITLIVSGSVSTKR